MNIINVKKPKKTASLPTTEVHIREEGKNKVRIIIGETSFLSIP